MTEAIDHERVAALHAQMTAGIAALAKTMKLVPKPPYLPRPMQPCEISIDIPYTRDEYAEILHYVLILRRMPLMPRDERLADGASSRLSYFASLIWNHPTAPEQRHFGPAYIRLARELNAVSSAATSWLDAAGYGIPY
ncbi:hypothetical protein LJ725_13000 [Reyranella aquatilis]|uniref:Uncharacterized protein n=1 Tax=Reyranella aquatilis TaxID=2035356 RepID=A0ABS8KUY6_9HYPH|nr:hypothetical protein [Reyranella aquatilis]MCC8429891.1 hypothetical protein [Reyranella aquatilis]